MDKFMSSDNFYRPEFCVADHSYVSAVRNKKKSAAAAENCTQVR